MAVEIELTKGQIAAVDNEDADLGNVTWYAQPARFKGNLYGYYTVRRNKGDRKLVYMHRVIMERMLGRELTKDEVVDHIDHNRLNNQRCNLRVCTRSQNRANGKMAITNKTGRKGVVMQGKRYVAQITVHKKVIRLGAFSTPDEAHQAYLTAARAYFGEFAHSGE